MKAKYKKGELVSFDIDNDTKKGMIVIIDYHNTPIKHISYDVFVDEDNCLYKHLQEEDISKL